MYYGLKFIKSIFGAKQMAVRKKIEKKPIDHWEREALEKIALSALGEQRIARRWSIFFKSITFFYIFVLLFLV